MTHHRLLPLVALVAATLSPLPTFARERLDLGGTWQSSLGECRLPGTTDESRLGPGQHPTDVDYQLTRLYPYSGRVTYSRTVDIPRAMARQPLRLVMERTKPSTLWVDGDSIGSLGHLYAPHVYYLYDGLAEGRHRIDIRIDNSPESVPAEIHGSHAWSDATQTNWNGILGDFYLEQLPSAYVETLQVYPDVVSNSVDVVLSIYSASETRGELRLSAEAWNTPRPYAIEAKDPIPLRLARGFSRYKVTFPMGSDTLLWSEFHPNMFRLAADISGRGFTDRQEANFGMRELAVRDGRFELNGKRIFLRGKHDACVFPLTGYAPMDVEAWRKVFRTARRYGINHYRFHSWAPPRAAFEAADIEGIYLAPELPLWGTIDSTHVALNQFLRREGRMLLDYVGNSPSFCMMGLGNELWGSVDEMGRWLDGFRTQDGRHLYNYGSNDFLGWTGPQEGEDFMTTCRVGYAVDQGDVDAREALPEPYSAHVRSSFSFADADEGGLLNALRPSTRRSYRAAVAATPRPIVSHETCQFQVYPDLSEVSKYTGVVYPYNYEVFRRRLAEGGMLGEADAFHQATGRWAMACCKADIEYCLRTPGMGGFQMLDLQDYPGQGSALVGPLDAFMEPKGITTPEAFSQSCAPVVPLALADSLCLADTDSLRFDLALFNYSEDRWDEPIYWSLTNADETFCADGEEPTGVEQGSVRPLCTLVVPLSSVRRATKVLLLLETGHYSNAYTFWIYPEAASAPYARPLASGVSGTGVREVHRLDVATIRALEAGASVLLCPDHQSVGRQTVGGLFTPDYWNYAMFRSISEKNQRPVSPGTLGFVAHADHPAFRLFPNDGRSDWQWWCIARHTRPLILDGSAPGLTRGASLSRGGDLSPLILQSVDNVNRSHLLGCLMEYRVGRGRLLICMTDLEALASHPEGRAYAASIRAYVSSPAFSPRVEATVADILRLLNRSVAGPDIQGVDNASDYAQPAR